MMSEQIAFANDAALKEVEAAISLLRLDRDNKQIGVEYLLLAQIYSARGNAADGRDALFAIQHALESFKQAADLVDEAWGHIRAGWEYAKLKQDANTEKELSEATSIADRTTDSALKANCKWASGERLRSSHPAAAEKLYWEAASHFHAAGDSTNEARLLALAANIELANDPMAAINKLLSAVRLIGTSEDASVRAFVLWSLGNAYQVTGDFASARAAYDRQIELSHASGLKSDEGKALLAESAFFQELGEWEEALALSKRALDLLSTSGDETGEAWAYESLIAIYTERNSTEKNFAEASSLYEKVRRMKGFSPSSMIETNLAEMAIQQGQFEEAKRQISTSLKYCETTGDPPCRTSVYMSMAEITAREHDFVSARKNLQLAEKLLPKISDVYLRGRFLYVSAVVARLSGDLVQSERLYRQLIDMIVALAEHSDATSRESMAESYSFIFDEFVGVLFSRYGNAREPEKEQIAEHAFAVAELNRSREFSRRWGRAYAEILKSEIPSS